MANKIIIIQSDGTHTRPMEQAQAEKYLGNLINDNRIANLKQSLNDVTGDKGKATGSYVFDGHAVLHASSGVEEVKSVSLFFYDQDDDHYIIAMGEHTAAKTYKLTDYGQETGAFKKNATISL
ncbi:MAG: hypothetical protein BGO31_09135 [Bacteroidetes bacterium 43-16]|nr:MAG: hypothetical protein BGO31_09135 [Bacteroidetes bacterium 43-16]